MFHHCHSTCSTWLLSPVSTGWSLDLLMHFFESSESFLYTHRSFCALLLLSLKLSSLECCQWRTLLSLHHGRPIWLLSNISHHWDPETATTSSGSCPKATKLDGTSRRFLKVIQWAFRGRAKQNKGEGNINTYFWRFRDLTVLTILESCCPSS
jgi:hypothetical protein